jgi:hypothetical protein
LGSDRRARRQRWAQDFGARHPRLALAIVCVLLAGVIVVCGYQLRYGTYLGHGWVIAALAGMATAVGLSAAALISIRRHGGVGGHVLIAWLVLTLASASAIKYPFPRGPYGSVQAFFNMVHAVLLGYEAVTSMAIVALLAYALAHALLHPRARARIRTAHAEHAPSRVELPARLRFPGAEAVTWRAGRLIAGNGTVTWLSRKGDVEVDLTSACQAPLMPPTEARKRQPRTTTLATASGLVEVDVSPIALETLASSLHRRGETTVRSALPLDSERTASSRHDDVATFRRWPSGHCTSWRGRRQCASRSPRSPAWPAPGVPGAGDADGCACPDGRDGDGGADDGVAQARGPRSSVLPHAVSGVAGDWSQSLRSSAHTANGASSCSPSTPSTTPRLRISPAYRMPMRSITARERAL